MRTDDKKAETVKNGIGVGKNRASVDNKGWVVEFLNQMMTTTDMEPMNEQQIQALIEKENKATKGIKSVCRSDQLLCDEANIKKEN